MESQMPRALYAARLSDWRTFRSLSSISLVCKGCKPAREIRKDNGCIKVTSEPLAKFSPLCFSIYERYLLSKRQKAGYVTGQCHLISAEMISH